MTYLRSVFLSGFLFALGLGVSGMTDANKVIGFLTLSREWDPSLLFVMGGGIGVHLLLFRWVLQRQSPVFDDVFRIPNRSEIDGRLVVGSALFGAGWGIGGFCPGPGLVSFASFGIDAVVFVAAMVVGMGAFHLLTNVRAPVREVTSC